MVFKLEGFPIELNYLGLVLVSIYIIYKAVYNYFLHPLAKVPGPFSAKIIPWWTARVLYSKDLSTEMLLLHQKYGSIVRIGPNELSFTSLEAHDVIYKVPFKKSEKGYYFSKDGTLQSTFTSLVFAAPTIGTVSDLSVHKKLKNRMQPAFTLKATIEQESLLTFHMDKVFSELDRLVNNGEKIDLSDYTSKMLWNIVSDLAFGEPIIQSKRDVFRRLQHFYVRSFPYMEIVTFVFPWIEKTIAVFGRMMPGITARAFFPPSQLRETLDRQDGRKDFLTSIRGKHQKEDGLELSWTEIYCNAAFFIVAGYFPIEVSQVAALYRVIHDQDVMQRLKNEIRNEFSTLEDITAERCTRLPFLNACVQESLRMIPPIASKFMSRRSPGAMIDGLWVPFGVQVYSEVGVMHRLPEYWAKADEFRPERWLPGAKDAPGSLWTCDNNAAYKPFSTGPRTCIGRESALQTLRMTIARLVHRYDIELEEPDSFLWERDVRLAGLWSGYRLPVKMTIRQ